MSAQVKIGFWYFGMDSCFCSCSASHDSHSLQATKIFSSFSLAMWPYLKYREVCCRGLRRLGDKWCDAFWKCTIKCVPSLLLELELLPVTYKYSHHLKGLHQVDLLKLLPLENRDATSHCPTGTCLQAVPLPFGSWPQCYAQLSTIPLASLTPYVCTCNFHRFFRRKIISMENALIMVWSRTKRNSFVDSTHQKYHI